MRQRPALALLVVSGAFLMSPRYAWAGMPSFTLSDLARMRVQTISFFLLGLLACAWAIQRIWNSVRRDFPRLPWLSYSRAMNLVVLWGLLFVLVLTMISGARELMTPGAWKKQGLTYTLPEKSSAPGEDASIVVRRKRLERLRDALWVYARANEGHLPSRDAIAAELWQVPDPSGMRYVYREGQRVAVGAALLAYEPGTFGSDRFALLTSGEIKRFSAADFQQALAAETP